MPPAHAPAEEKDIASDGGDASDVRLTPESPPVMASASDTTAPSATATAAVTSATRPPAADAAPADGAEADPGGNGNHGDAELESEAVTVNVVLPDAKKEDDSIVFPLLPTDCVQDIRHFVAEYPQAYIHTAFYFEFAGERLNDMLEVGAIEGLVTGSKIYMRYDTYTERGVRVHVRRLQDMMQPSGSSAQPVSNYNGQSILTQMITAPIDETKFAAEAKLAATLGDIPLQNIYGGAPSAKQAPDPPLTSLAYSGWNAPPGNRMLKGDILYLRAVTTTGAVAHIVASTKGFYVCRSTDTVFKPTESSTRPCRSHTLVGTLSSYCPVFKARFNALLKPSADRPTLELLLTPCQINPWMIGREAHEMDELRAENAASIWSEADPLNPGMIRDWNDDLQNLRELPCVDDASRLFRDRVFFKFNSDYVAAATRGAQAAVLGNIPPMNPADEPESHMFIWNNMFLSFATNSRGIFSALGGEEGAHVAANNDLKGVRLFSSIPECPLYTLATVVVDYMGRRVIAQSMIPGILRKDQTNTIVYGANDADQSMVVNPRFNDALRALSVPLRAKEHSIEYLDNETYIINSSSESKGIAGTDGRMYMLDLTRTTPADVNFVEEARRVGGAGAAPTYALFGADAEAVSWAPRHGLYCLRKELLDTFCARKMRGDPVTAAGAAEAVAKAKAAAAAGTLVEKPPLQPTPIFNLDVFTNVTVVGDGDEAAADKALVAEAGEFLLATVIPAFAGDLAAMYQTAMDGTALTASMHARGINMRYLGCIASGLAALGTQQTRPILKICCIEMLARAVKHQLRALMKATDIAQMAETISQFLNCLVWSPVATAKKRKGKHAKKSTGLELTAPQLWATVGKACFSHFQTRISVANGVGGFLQLGPAAEGMQVSKLALLRSVCKKTGVQLLARQYNLSNATSTPTFNTDDILDVFPLTKHMAPTSGEGDRLYNEGCAKSRAGLMREAADLLERSLQVMQQTYGLMHEGIADCYRQLAIIFTQAEQFEFAVSYQEKAMLTSESVRGRDHPETMRDIIFLGQYLRVINQRDRAITVLQHARDLCSIAVDTFHQEHALLDTYVALCHLEMNRPTQASVWLDRVLACQTELFGENDIQCAQTDGIKARALQRAGDVRGALSCARAAHAIYSEKLGDSHRKSRDMFAFVNRLAAEAVRVQRAKLGGGGGGGGPKKSGKRPIGKKANGFVAVR